MNNSKITARYSPIWVNVRPVIVGVLSAFAVMLGLLALFSLVFMILESIVDSAVLPLALIAAAVGCCVGAYICTGCLTGRGGLLFGTIIGAIMFAGLWVASMFTSECAFGSENIVKIILLVGSGCIGGYLGCNRRSIRRKK